MKHLLLLCLALLTPPLLAQSLALDVFNGTTFEQVEVNLGANSLLGFDGNGDPARITAGTGITISGNVITSSGSGSSTLAALTDVTLTSPANLQLLRYNSASSKWVNWTPDFLVSSDLSGYLTSAAAASAYASLSGSYSNPSWITSLAWSKISGTPTTLAGYGISDGLTSATAASTYATISALDLKAPLDSPTFTGSVVIPGGATISGYVTNLDPYFNGVLTWEHVNTTLGTQTSTLSIPEELASMAWTTPAESGRLLTHNSSLNGSNISSGTVADARLSANVSLLGSTIALASEVSGTLPIANGGTGQTTAANARIALLPSMTGNGGKFLRVNAGATDYELATIGGGGDALTTSSLDQFADVTQTATKTLAITDSTTLAGGTHSGTNTGDQTTITGNAGTATTLATGRTLAITGDLAWTSPSFNGSANVTAAGTLATVATAGTTGSSTAIPVITINAKGLTTGITTAAVIAPAGTLTGTTLASNVVTSALTSLGTISTGVWQGTALADSYISSAATWNAKESALTFSTGLTRSTNTITVNTSQNIATLSNLTSNGFVKTSGGTGALSIDTATYLTTTGNGSSLTGLTQSQISGLTTTDRASFANVRPTHSTLTYAGTTDIDMDGNGFQTVTLTGNITFTTSNRAAGRSKTIRIIGDSSLRTFTFPGGWTWIGAAAPASIAASKDAILTITAFGTADSDIIAAYAVEP